MAVHLGEIVTEDFTIPSDTPGINLHIRNKRQHARDAFADERVLLMTHGATYSSASVYDVELDGFSFMDYLASHGYDVYAVDIRGYGGSSRPSEMEQPAGDNPPVVRTDIAVRDLATAADFVRSRRQISKLNILGMSWGGTVAGAYVSRNNAKVNKLVLVAPQWLSTKPAPIDTGAPLGSYRVINVAETKERWLAAVPENKRSSFIPCGWFERWAAVTLETDSWDETRSSHTIRAPSGAVQDIREYWTAGKPYYNPGDITTPTLLVHAEWDRDAPLEITMEFFTSLTGASYRRWVEIGEGTHLILLERNRLQAYSSIWSFLDEDHTPAR